MSVAAKSSSIKWYIHCAITLCIMIFFRYIPAPEPMTQAGITVVGIFLGAIYGWCTTNFIWPSIAALVLFGFSGAANPLVGWGSLMSTPAVAACFWLMICVGLLSNSNLIQYIANWSISLKFTHGKPWLLFTMIYLAELICGACLNEAPVVLAFWGLLWSMFDAVGYEKGSKTAAWAIFTTPVVVGFGMFMLPFKPAILTNFGFLAAGSNGLYDGSYDYGIWMIYAFTVVLAMFAVWMLFSRFILRIDLSKFVDYVPERQEVQKMTKKQKYCLTLFVILVVVLVAPSFLPKGLGITAILNRLNTPGIAMVCVAVTSLLRIDGEPLMKVEDMIASNVIWNVIFMFGTALVLCSFINSPEAAVGDWIKVFLAPILSKMSPFTYVICILMIGCIITNFINNAVVGALLIPVSFSISMSFGVNPVALCACLILFVDFGIMLPSASPVGAMLYSNLGWIPNKTLHLYCIFAVLLYVGTSYIVGWPLANLLFPYAG